MSDARPHLPARRPLAVLTLVVGPFSLVLASGCTPVTVDMKTLTPSEEPHTTVVYSGRRQGEARFADYAGIDGSILDE